MTRGAVEAGADGPPAWVLAAIVALAAALRIHLAARSPLWFDEIYFVLVARHPAAEVLRLIGQDVHPPLPFVLARGWQVLGGEHAAWLKALPILTGLGTVWLTFMAGRDLFSPWTGALAAALLAVHAAHVRSSQEYEVFAGLALWPLALAWLAWRWTERRRRSDAAAFVACGAAALYTHYLLSFVFLTVSLWGLARVRRDRSALRSWTLLQAAVVLLFLPQVPGAWEQFVREGSGAYFQWPRAHELSRLARQLLFGTGRLSLAFAALAILPALRRDWRPQIGLIALLVVVPLAAKRALPLVVPRDFLGLAPLACLAVAAGVGLARPRVLSGALATALLAVALAVTLGRSPHYEAVELARAAAYLREHARPGDLVVHAETHSYLFFRYHAPDWGRHRLWDPSGRGIPFFEGGLVVPLSDLLSGGQEREALRGTRGAWWAMRVDRAYVTRGRGSRAGAAAAAAIDSVAGPPAWSLGSVTLWRGRAAQNRPRNDGGSVGAAGSRGSRNRAATSRSSVPRASRRLRPRASMVS